MALDLEDLPDRVADLLDRAGRAVVGVGGRGWGGSGVIVGDGAVLTNAHNVRGEEVHVSVGDEVRTATVTAVDRDGDLAVLAVDTGDVTPLWHDDDVDPAVGQAVIAMAAPHPRGLTATVGFVSAVGRRFRGPGGWPIEGALEHTAPLPRGSSGGPVLDLEGRLLGVNTHRRGEGFYLATPLSADLRRRVAAMHEGVAPSRPRLGLALAPARVARRLRASVGLEPRDGLLVRAVEEDSPAAAADIRAGDLVVRAGGADIARADDLYRALRDLEGGELTLGLVRGAEELEVTVSLDG